MVAPGCKLQHVHHRLGDARYKYLVDGQKNCKLFQNISDRIFDLSLPLTQTHHFPLFSMTIHDFPRFSI